MMRKWFLPVACCILILLVVMAAGCTGKQGAAMTQGSGHLPKTMDVTKPALSETSSSPAGTAAQGIPTASLGPASPLLGRPTNHSVNINVLPSENRDIHLQYRNSTSPAVQQTAPVAAQAGVPADIVIYGLAERPMSVRSAGTRQVKPRPPAARNIRSIPGEFPDHRLSLRFKRILTSTRGQAGRCITRPLPMNAPPRRIS